MRSSGLAGQSRSGQRRSKASPPKSTLDLSTNMLVSLLQAQCQGFGLSSGRAELAGAIVALLSQDYIQLKADNQGMVNKTLKHVQLGH